MDEYLYVEPTCDTLSLNNVILFKQDGDKYYSIDELYVLSNLDSCGNFVKDVYKIPRECRLTYSQEYLKRFTKPSGFIKYKILFKSNILYISVENVEELEKYRDNLLRDKFINFGLKYHSEEHYIIDKDYLSSEEVFAGCAITFGGVDADKIIEPRYYLLDTDMDESNISILLDYQYALDLSLNRSSFSVKELDIDRIKFIPNDLMVNCTIISTNLCCKMLDTNIDASHKYNSRYIIY